MPHAIPQTHSSFYLLCFRMRSATTTTQDGGTQNCISTCATLRAHIRALNNYSYDVMNHNTPPLRYVVQVT